MSMSYKLSGTENIYNYMTGGHAVATLKSCTGKHYTYRFQAPDGRKPGDDVLFIYVLIDGSLWNYVGMYRNRDFKLTQKSRYDRTSPIVRGVCFILKMMLLSGFTDDRVELYHEGVCSRCGRPLTNPESIEIGIGPKCRELR